MRIIGITGGIGSGKSRVLNIMEEIYGAVLCQTDVVAHQLQKKGETCYKEIVNVFGVNILTENKEIDRKKLGAIVFNDNDKLKKLNQIVHPAVKKQVKLEIEEARRKQKEFFLIESALLMEDHYEELCDELWYIYADERVRRDRLKTSRLMNEEKIDLIIKAQATEETFRKYCHITIDNSGTIENTKEQIEQAVNRR
ncbi:dephospho-CoA kinase [Lachnospiraceae bacterium 2_1_46FAA]|nr:dephospho-CoA kinase [Lachnospiraceae bacterium 2_1_46FAA]